MDNKKKALGKGLEQLFTNNVIDFDNFENTIVENTKKNDITEIPLSEIRSNPYQPRKNFDENALNELAQSIREYGVVQPIIVKKSVKGYELVAGERRCKASKLAGLDKVPAVIKEFTDQEMMEIALIENVQREDLNPMEVAESMDQIIKIKNMTQDEFATKFGKSRSYITNMLGLLKLPKEVKKLVENKDISMSHARCLSKLDDEEKIINIANKIIVENLSVREVENLINKKPTLTEIKKPKEIYNYKMYEELISEKFSEKVKVKNNKIELYFDGKKDLIRLLDELNIKVDD